MLALRRKTVQTAGRLPIAVARSTRQYSSGHDDTHKPGGDHSHGHHSEPANESLGTGFYLVLAAVPISLGVYTVSRPGKDGKLAGFSSIIESYSDYKEKWAARNTLHTAAIEAAAFDRNLYQSAQGTTHVELRFPEIFNTGSPYNVIAGQGSKGMDELVAHYQKLNVDEEEKKAKALAAKEN